MNILRRFWADLLDLIPFNVVLAGIMWLMSVQLTYTVAHAHPSAISFAEARLGIPTAASLIIFYMVSCALMIPRPPGWVYAVAFLHMVVFASIMVIGGLEGYWSSQSGNFEATLLFSVGILSVYALRILQAQAALTARLRLAEQKIDILLDQLEETPRPNIEKSKIIAIKGATSRNESAITANT